MDSYQEAFANDIRPSAALVVDREAPPSSACNPSRRDDAAGGPCAALLASTAANDVVRQPSPSGKVRGPATTSHPLNRPYAFAALPKGPGVPGARGANIWLEYKIAGFKSAETRAEKPAPLRHEYAT